VIVGATVVTGGIGGLAGVAATKQRKVECVRHLRNLVQPRLRTRFSSEAFSLPRRKGRPA